MRVKSPSSRSDYSESQDFIEFKNKYADCPEEINIDDYDDDKLLKLMLNIRTYCKDCANRGLYHEAKTARSLSTAITAKKSARDSEIQQRPVISLMSDDALSEMDERLAQFDEQTDEKRAQLNKLHSQQMEQLETVWRDEKPHQYRKPSHQLLALKEQERKYSMVRDYEAAQRLHDEYEARLEEETKQAQEQLVADYRKSTKKKREQQESELKMFEEKRAAQRELLVVKRDSIVRAMKNRESVISSYIRTSRSKRFAHFDRFSMSRSEVESDPSDSDSRGLEYDEELPEEVPVASSVEAPSTPVPEQELEQAADNYMESETEIKEEREVDEDEEDKNARKCCLLL